MATMLQPTLPTGVNSFPPSPTLSPSYTDLVSLDTGLPYHHDLDSKRSFVHAEYDKSFAPSIPSTAPSSPLYTHSMGSRDSSYFSTPSYSSLDPNEEFDYDDDDPPFPSFGNNTHHSSQDQHLKSLHNLEDDSSESVRTASPPLEKTRREETYKDDHSVVHEPTRHVDYLSHEWEEQDIWSSWRYVHVRERRKQFDPKETLTNGERLENAAWRTWTKAKYKLKTISPESLNWMKDCDVTWLYGPLQIDKKSVLYEDRSPPPSQLSTCSSFLNKKPILKKKSASVALLERSLTEHNLLSRVGEIIRVQQASPVPRKQGLRRGGSDFSLPSYHSSVLTTPDDLSRQDHPPRYSFGTDTPSESKHVLFNETVRQVQAIESEDDEKDEQPEEDFSESDEDDDGGLMMAPARSRSNRSTPRGSFSDNNKTIAPLPSTTLKYRKDTPEPPEMSISQAPLWTPSRSLQHSSSQETLKPSNPSHNFLLDDDPELSDDPWPSKNRQQSGYSPYAREDQGEPYGMRRTASGMFMPYDENEEEAVMNNTLFGQAMYAVNTFRDIAHVVWNVGWNRGR